MGNILRSISKSVAVAAYVHQQEALSIRSYSEVDSDITQRHEQIDLQSFIDCGLLTIVSPETEAEKDTFVSFAAALTDNGEAITGAIAFHRNWSIGCDDRRAIKFFAENVPQRQVITTPELIKYWVDTANPALDVVRIALQKIRIQARYEPSIKHHLYFWWQMYKGNQE